MLCRGLLWVLKCLLDIAYGVEYMHFSGVLHGDLKCANVLCKACSTDIRGFICKVGLYACMPCSAQMSSADVCTLPDMLQGIKEESCCVSSLPLCPHSHLQ